MIRWPQEGYHTKLEPFDDTRFEYETTEGQRKGVVSSPPGDGWQEIDWLREEYTDTALWRRPRAAGQST